MAQFSIGILGSHILVLVSEGNSNIRVMHMSIYLFIIEDLYTQFAKDYFAEIIFDSNSIIICRHLEDRLTE